MEGVVQHGSYNYPLRMRSVVDLVRGLLNVWQQQTEKPAVLRYGAKAGDSLCRPVIFLSATDNASRFEFWAPAL